MLRRLTRSLLLSLITITGANSAIMADTPVFSTYRGISIGTSMTDARAKLGEPKERSDERDYFVFTGNENTQVFYDGSRNVRAIMVTYEKITEAPTAKAVFGQDVVPQADGGIFKMVRYPKAGFFVSYTKLSGDNPMVIIAMQKI
jgi:hypothetical protein